MQAILYTRSIDDDVLVKKEKKTLIHYFNDLGQI